MVNKISAQQRGLIRSKNFEEFLKDSPEGFEYSFGLGLSAQDILENLGLDFVEDALEGLSAFVSALSLVVDLIATLTDIIALSLGVAIDTFQALALLIKQTLESVIDLFTGASISPLFHFPQTYKSRRTPSEVLYDVGMAYLDEQDSNRPITVSENFGIAVVALFSAPNLEQLMLTFDNITKQFKGIASFDDGGDSFASRWNRVDEAFPRKKYLVKGTSGMAPDFSYKIDLTEFLFVGQIVRSLNSLVQQIEKGRTSLDKVSQIIDLAQRRISTVNTLANKILTAINSLAALLALGDANTVFVCSGVGKDEDFAKGIINAPLHPEYPRSTFIEEINTQSKSRGLPNVLNREIGEQSLFSGALLLHLQTPSPSSETEEARKILRLLNLLYSPQETQDSFDQRGDRLTQTGRSLSRSVQGGN